MTPSTGRVVHHPVIAPQAWCGFVHVVSDGADAIEERVYGLFLVKRQGTSGAAGTLSWSSRMGCSRGGGGGRIACTLAERVTGGQSIGGRGVRWREQRGYVGKGVARAVRMDG